MTTGTATTRTASRAGRRSPSQARPAAPMQRNALAHIQFPNGLSPGTRLFLTSRTAMRTAKIASIHPLACMSAGVKRMGGLPSLAVRRQGAVVVAGRPRAGHDRVADGLGGVPGSQGAEDAGVITVVQGLDRVPQAVRGVGECPGTGCVAARPAGAGTGVDVQRVVSRLVAEPPAFPHLPLADSAEVAGGLRQAVRGEQGTGPAGRGAEVAPGWDDHGGDGGGAPVAAAGSVMGGSLRARPGRQHDEGSDGDKRGLAVVLALSAPGAVAVLPREAVGGHQQLLTTSGPGPGSWAEPAPSPRMNRANARPPGIGVPSGAPSYCTAGPVPAQFAHPHSVQG